MNLYCVMFAVISLVMALAFFTGKAPDWIKGYREMDEEEKNNILIVPLCRNLGVVFFLAFVIFFLAFMIPAFLDKAFVPSVVIWMIGAGADLYYIEKSKRYNKER